MNAIDALFARLRAQGRKALIPFVTAGDPDLDTTTELVHELVRNGAGMIEIGFPYSDPIADGPVIQASYARALARGITVDDILAWSKRISQQPPFRDGVPPLIAMLSYSLVYRRGAERFLDEARLGGFSGAIVPDLPPEEAASLARLAADRHFRMPMLVTPTTPPGRAAQICKVSTGFLYCVSVRGITGERDRLPADLTERLRWLRRQSALPLCVGFGISRPAQVRELRPLADGIIVGSALVRHLELAGKRPIGEVISDIGALVHSLADALTPTELGGPQARGC